MHPYRVYTKDLAVLAAYAAFELSSPKDGQRRYFESTKRLTRIIEATLDELHSVKKSTKLHLPSLNALNEIIERLAANENSNYPDSKDHVKPAEPRSVAENVLFRLKPIYQKLLTLRYLSPEERDYLANFFTFLARATKMHEYVT